MSQETTDREVKKAHVKSMALKTFLFCLVSCVTVAVVLIWSDGRRPLFLTRLVMTSFVVGLGSYLMWFTMMLMEIREDVAQGE